MHEVIPLFLSYIVRPQDSIGLDLIRSGSLNPLDESIIHFGKPGSNHVFYLLNSNINSSLVKSL
jgi:hypothetical protein